MKEGKIRKFAYNQESSVSNTETTLSSVDTRGSWPTETDWLNNAIPSVSTTSLSIEGLDADQGTWNALGGEGNCNEIERGRGGQCIWYDKS